MFALFFIGFVVMAIMMIAGRSNGQAAAAYQKLMSSGVQARGIFLSVNNTGVRQAGGMRSSMGMPLVRFERREVLLDVELPGKAPYEVGTMVLIPGNLVRDVLPGATVELRVDPRDPANIAVVGLGIGLPAAASLATGKP